MAAVRGGDIRQFILDGRELDPAAESEWNVMLGGRENETAISGNGSLHVTQKRVPSKVTGCAISCDNERGDHEFLHDLKEAGEPVPCTLSLADGTTYSGSLVVSGEVAGNTGNGQVTFELAGARLEKI
jgi:hypothetical protein